MRSMAACRELEQKYGLIPADRKQKSLSSLLSLKPVHHKSSDIKRQISNTVRTLLQTYKFRTFGEYNALLSCFNIDVKQVRGERFGREYGGMVYAAKNDAREIVSRPFKSSLLGKMFGAEALNKNMKNHTETMNKKDMIGRSRSVVAAAMKTAEMKEAFEQMLREKNMDAVFRSNAAGRIYGVTFIDHETGVVLNGSRPGKEFSANVFHAWFNESRQPQNPAAMRPFPRPDAAGERDASLPEESAGLLDIRPHGEDYEEIAFARRMKRKKRRQKRRTQ